MATINYSNGSNQPPRTTRTSPVSQGTVSERKKTFGEKCAETFLAEDLADVKEAVKKEAVKYFKDAVLGLLFSGLSRMFYGNNSAIRPPSFTGRSNAGQRTTYNSLYDNSGTMNAPKRMSYKDVGFNTREDAAAVRGELIGLLEANPGSVVTVAEFFDAAKLSSTADVEDYTWGWRSLDEFNAPIIYGQGLWYIDFPRPESIAKR